MKTFLFLTFLFSTLSTAGEESFSFEKLDSFFQSKQYESGLKYLKEIPFPNKDRNPFYYYNLGNLNYRLGKAGLAVAYLEKANHILPQDKEIKKALKLARNGMPSLETPEINPDLILTGTALLCFLLSLVWILHYLRERKPRRVFSSPVGILNIVILALGIGTYAVLKHAETHPKAVCIESQIIRSGPGETFSEISRLEPGMKVEWLETGKKEWRQIEWGGGNLGWVSESSLLLF